MRFEQKNASEKRIIFPIPTQKILLGYEQIAERRKKWIESTVPVEIIRNA